MIITKFDEKKMVKILHVITYKKVTRLSDHKQVSLMRLRCQRWFSHHHAMYRVKTKFTLLGLYQTLHKIDCF